MSEEIISESLIVTGLAHSPTIAFIALALAGAQGEMSGAKKSSDNPFFSSRYADLASVIGAIREPLAKHEIAHVQAPGSDEHGTFVDTMLIHSSGEWLRCRIRMNAPDVFHKESREWVSGDTPQGRGSVITYMRRYALQAMSGLEAEDDDGEKGMRRDSSPKPKALPPTKPLPAGSFKNVPTVPLPKPVERTAPAVPSDGPGNVYSWKGIRCHIGTKGGRVEGKELGVLAQTSIDWIKNKLSQVSEPNQQDNILIAALAMREAELNPTAAQPELGTAKPNLNALRAKCESLKIALPTMAKVSRALGGASEYFADIPEDEAGFMLANWNDTMEAVKFENDNLPV